MSVNDLIADRKFNVAKLRVDSHAVDGRERGDAVPRILVVCLRQKFLAIGRRRWAEVAGRLGRVVLNLFAVFDRRSKVCQQIQLFS